MPTLAAFPRMLKRDRERHGLRVARAAWFLGVTMREYRELEAGDRTPGVDTWERMVSRCTGGRRKHLGRRWSGLSFPDTWGRHHHPYLRPRSRTPSGGPNRGLKGKYFTAGVLAILAGKFEAAGGYCPVISSIASDTRISGTRCSQSR